MVLYAYTTSIRTAGKPLHSYATPIRELGSTFHSHTASIRMTIVGVV